MFCLHSKQNDERHGLAISPLRKNRRMVVEIPVCFALLPADVIYQDASTKKWNILGCFDLFGFTVFPAEIQIGVFFGLMDGRGEMSLKIRVVNADSDLDDSIESQVAGEFEARINMPTPNDAVQATVPIPLKFDAPGIYHLELLVDDKPLMTRRLTIKEVPGAPQ